MKIFSEIKNILGSESVKILAKDKLLIKLPINILKFKKERKKYEKYREYIRLLFKKNNLLITRFKSPIF
jgi:hypothetical protein